MKRFVDVDFKNWMLDKMEAYEIASSINTAYCYEVLKETEKAVQLHVFDPERKLPSGSGWTKWYPKSSIENIEEVLA